MTTAGRSKACACESRSHLWWLGSVVCRRRRTERRRTAATARGWSSTRGSVPQMWRNVRAARAANTVSGWLSVDARAEEMAELHSCARGTSIRRFARGCHARRCSGGRRTAQRRVGLVLGGARRRNGRAPSGRNRGRRCAGLFRVVRPGMRLLAVGVGPMVSLGSASECEERRSTAACLAHISYAVRCSDALCVAA